MVAPVIVAAIPTILEIGGKLIERLFPDPEDAAQAKLKLFELQQSGQLAELDAWVKAMQADVEDRANARQREIMTGDVWTPRILAYLLTVGFFGVLGAVMAWGVPESTRDTVNLLLGSLGTVWLGAMSYYHGTTAGSRAKTELLAKMEFPR
jgi:hypothetical protein